MPSPRSSILLVGAWTILGLEGNFDGDNDIDITDFNFLASNFAPDGYGTSVVPEPSALVLALLAVILLGMMSFVSRLR